jgi:subtilisin-like proprotein convertase family protein
MKTLILLFSVLFTTMSFAQVPSYVPTNGLVGWWPFNGNANDETINNFNGILTGGQYTAGRGGVANTAILFNSSTAGYVDVNIGNNLVGQFSVMMWIRADRSAGYVGESNVCPGGVSVPMANSNQNWAIIPNQSGSNLGVGLSFVQNGIMVGEHAPNILVSRLSHSSNSTTFNQVVIVYRTDSTFLYLNGLKVRSRAIYCTTNNKFIGPSIRFGGSLYSPNFAGIIDDIGIWNRAITDCEIQNLYSSTNPTNTTSQTACGSYVWNGTTYTASGVYTGPTANCVTESLNLTITPSSANTTSQTACDSYVWNGTTYTASGVYTGINQSVAGLTFLPDGAGLQYETSIGVSGFDQTTLITSAANFDQLCLDIEHSFIGDLEITLTCPNGTTVSIMNTYNGTSAWGALVPGGCGSGIGTSLGNDTNIDGGAPGPPVWTYCFSPANATLGTICAENTAGNTIPNDYTASGINLPNATTGNNLAMDTNGVYLPDGNFNDFIGCPVNGNWTITVQDNQSLDDGYIFQWGLVFGLLPANCVNESLNLTITPSSTNTTSQTACGYYVWNDTTYTASGVYTGTTTNCVTESLNLTITPSFTNTTSQTACGYYVWNDTTYTASGVYTGTTTNCVTESLNLTITPSSTNTTTASACNSYTWNGTTYTASGVYIGTITNCVTESLNLTIAPATTTGSISTSICAGGSYIWPANGQTYTTAQSGVTVVTDCNTATLNLTITPSSTNTTTASACNSYTWNGITYTASGVYTGTTANCITQSLNLTITPATTTGSVSASICAGGSYIWPANGQTYTTAQSGVTVVTGCNTATLNLTINPNSTSTTTTSSCGTYTWVNNGQTYTQSGVYTVISANCVTQYLNLTITPSAINTTTALACNFIDWYGTTYTVSGVYAGTTTNCVTQYLNLTITPSYTNTTTVAACNNYAWNGQTYTQSGVYTGTTSNCVTQALNLTINTNTSSSISQTALDSYTWPVNNQTYTTTGAYTAVIPNAAGCDSTITLNLTMSFTGINDLSASKLSVYPNPTTGDFTITGLELVGTVSSLTLTDMNGKVVKVLDTKATKFSMASIKPGVYFLNIISGNKQEVLKIVKE